MALSRLLCWSLRAVIERRIRMWRRTALCGWLPKAMPGWLSSSKKLQRESTTRIQFSATAQQVNCGGKWTNSPPDASVGRKAPLHRLLGEKELAIGNLTKGIEHLATLLRLMEPQSFVNSHTQAQTVYRLGVAYMRLGETQNCCLRHTPESCILPIRGGGLHRKPDGSKQAISPFQTVLLNVPENTGFHIKAKWLLNIAYMTLGGYPHDVPPQYLIPPEILESDQSIPRLVNIAPSLGLDTFDLAGGAILDDFTNDDHLDIMVSTYDSTQNIRFFVNDREGMFSDRTEMANLVGLLGGFNILQADYDNDGHLDVLVLRGAWLAQAGRHPNSLLRNNDNGTFTDVTFDAGLGEVHDPTQTAAWADFDNDGDLDLYIGNETSHESITPCQLFRNNGNGTFTDVAEKANVLKRNFTKAVAWGHVTESSVNSAKSMKR